MVIRLVSVVRVLAVIPLVVIMMIQYQATYCLLVEGDIIDRLLVKNSVYHSSIKFMTAWIKPSYFTRLMVV